jgi:hypothetical protein
MGGRRLRERDVCLIEGAASDQARRRDIVTPIGKCGGEIVAIWERESRIDLKHEYLMYYSLVIDINSVCICTFVR